MYPVKEDSYDRSFDQDASFDDRDYSIDDRRANYRGREDDSYEDRYEMAEEEKFGRNYDQDVEEDSRYGDGYRQEKEFRRYDSYDLPEEKYNTVSKREQEDLYLREEHHRRDLYEEEERQIKGREDAGTFNGYSFEEDQIPYDSFEKTEGSFDDYDKDIRSYPANSMTKDSGYQTCDRRGSGENHYDQKIQSSSPGIGMMVAKEGSNERSIPGSQDRKGSSLSVQSQERRPSGGGVYDQSYERKPSSATIDIYDQLHSRKSSAAGLYEPLVDRTQSSGSPFEQKSMSIESRSNDSSAQLQKMQADQQPIRDVSPIQDLAFCGTVRRPSATEAMRDKESETLGYLLHLWPIDIVLVNLWFD